MVQKVSPAKSDRLVCVSRGQDGYLVPGCWFKQECGSSRSRSPAQIDDIPGAASQSSQQDSKYELVFRTFLITSTRRFFSLVEPLKTASDQRQSKITTRNTTHAAQYTTKQQQREPAHHSTQQHTHAQRTQHTTLHVHHSTCTALAHAHSFQSHPFSGRRISLSQDQSPKGWAHIASHFLVKLLKCSSFCKIVKH